jgi:hypothetical protein
VRRPPPAGGRGEESSRALLWVLLGVLGMVTGGFLAVQGATGMVDTFGMTESVVGLTALDLATSAEMFALVFAAHRRGVAEVAVAGAAGSVAYNATVSLARRLGRPARPRQRVTDLRPSHWSPSPCRWCCWPVGVPLLSRSLRALLVSGYRAPRRGSSPAK